MLNIILRAVVGAFICISTMAFTQDFKSTYQDWKDPNNSFVSYIREYNQARVIFCGSESPSHDNDGQNPTVSEGMGYGLLLAYANEDQTLFDQFLRYVLAVGENYGCSNYDPAKKMCYTPSPFLMPWIVNAQGKPFNFIPDPSNPGIYYYSNGSATDADMQIAWAVYLAANRAKAGYWSQSTFQTSSGTLSYNDVFEGMAHAIRLSDIDLTNFRISPGSQWGPQGQKVLYPGYFTPQAFAALNTVPKPDISETIPSSPPKPPTPISQAADLEIVYKNNVAAGVSIDYLGGAGNLTVDNNFHPKPGVQSGYSVDAVTTAVATMKTKDPNYNNATIQAALYDAQGQKTIYCNYYLEYKGGVWTVSDKGSSPEGKCEMKGNVAYVFLTEKDIQKVDFDYGTVQTNTLQAIADFQSWKDTGLFPNVIQYDKQYQPGAWSNDYGFDACRFPLWVSAFLVKNPSPTMKQALTLLLTTLETHLEKGADGYTMPSQGIDALTGENKGDATLSPPLNAPLYVAYKLMGDATLAGELEDGVLGYDLKQLQPKSTDPKGDSTPYFNAAMTLISEAVLNNKLQ